MVGDEGKLGMDGGGVGVGKGRGGNQLPPFELHQYLGRQTTWNYSNLILRMLFAKSKTGKRRMIRRKLTS